MKLIYMEQTLSIMFQQNTKQTQTIVESGIVKKTESGLRYLIINE
jgi:hypothetical protein